MRDTIMIVRTILWHPVLSVLQPMLQYPHRIRKWKEAFLLTVSEIEADKSRIWNSVELYNVYCPTVVSNIVAGLFLLSCLIILDLIFCC